MQAFIGARTFTKYGLSTNKGELLFYLVAPTNISVLSHTNIEIKIRHLMMVLSALPDIEIVCTDSSECFDDNKAYLSGVLFLDGRCNLQSTNLIIYGHNMRNGTMFSNLKKYVDRDFLNAHRTVKFETADGVQTYTVTEVLKTNTSDAWYDRIAAEDGRRLILSTCYGSGKDGRLLIIAAET